MTETNEKSMYFARLILRGDYDIYQHFQQITRIPTWDEEKGDWSDVHVAANKLQALLRRLSPETPGLSDLRKIDFDAVDYTALVHEELDEREH